MSSIRVGHVEVPELWIEFETNSSLTAQEVIDRSGMKPRDGTRVDCYHISGELVADFISPGQTVMIGTHPPSEGFIALSPIVRTFHIKWEKWLSLGRGRGSVTGSGYIGDGCTLWVPGIRSGRKIRAVELIRSTNRNGKLHAKGHRIRWDLIPYYKNDIALVASSGNQRFRLFDPQTRELTIPVSIEQESFDGAKKVEAILGKRFLWAVRVLNFDSDGRRVLASVESSYTWDGADVTGVSVGSPQPTAA